MRVISLTGCRELLAAWGRLRERIVRGEICGLALCIKSHDGKEEIVLCGDYQQDRAGALAASMKMSWELTKQSDFRRSQ